MLGLTAEQFGTVLLAGAMTIIALIGGKEGKRIANGRGSKPSDVMEVAGAIVSDKAVTAMVRSLDEFSAASTLLKSAIDKDVAAKVSLTEALRENSRALERNSDTADDMRDGIKDAATKVGALALEMRLGQRGG